MTRQQLTDEQIEERFLKAKPGRKPMPAAPAVPGELNMAVAAEDLAAADHLIELRADYAQDRDLANQLLGQAQMADSISKFTNTVSISKLAFVKEHKLYRALKGRKMPNGSAFQTASHGEDIEKMPNGSAFSGTWDEYCALLGMSKDKVDLDIANLQAFGEEALESMSAMGIGYRELRQYRKLPEDQQQALIEVAKTGDKDSFVELAEEIIVKHAKEKEQHAKDLKAATDKIEAKDRVIAINGDKINQLLEQANQPFEPPKGSVAQSQQEQDLLVAIERATVSSRLGLQQVFHAANAALDGARSESIQLAARQAVEYLCQQLVDVAEAFAINVDFEERIQPSWCTPEAIDAQMALNAEREATEKNTQKQGAAL